VKDKIMLWALLALYLFGSSGVSDHFAYIERMRTFFKKEVQDSARRDELLAIVDSSERMIKKQNAARGSIVKELSKIADGCRKRVRYEGIDCNSKAIELARSVSAALCLTDFVFHLNEAGAFVKRELGQEKAFVPRFLPAIPIRGLPS
jgi:hypothetical protein